MFEQPLGRRPPGPAGIMRGSRARLLRGIAHDGARNRCVASDEKEERKCGSDHAPQLHEDRRRRGWRRLRSARARLRRRTAQGRLHLSRADRRLRLDLGAREGPQGDGRRAQGPGRRRLCGEREGRRERGADPQGPRAAGPQAHLHDLLRLHGPDGRGRQAVPERDVRALHRLQARRQSRDLQFALPSGPRGRGHDRRPDVEVGHDRLSRLLQGAGSRARA